MAVVVSLLRGVNVGGHHKISMADLRALFELLGLRGPQTYVQSGNVVFRTDEKNLRALATRIESAIEKSAGFRPGVILRTAGELRKAVAQNPFSARPGIEPGKLIVFFPTTELSGHGRESALQIKSNPEELKLGGREIYIYYPNGSGRSKLTIAVLEKAVGTPCTGRNWNSVTKLLEMADSMEASA